MPLAELKHWHAVEKISVEQAGLLIAGVDPFDTSASPAEMARGRTYELALRQAAERAFSYAHSLVHRLDQEPHDPALVDIWEMSDNFDRYLPSIELRNSVAEVLRDPENVRLLLPIDPWFSETVYSDEITRWIEANRIESAYEFPGEQHVVVRDRGLTTWKDWHADQLAAVSTQIGAPSSSEGWPWGDYETALLRKLAAAAQRFWVNYDPSDATTAATNAQVTSWLKAQGVAERTAEVMATILRVDGLLGRDNHLGRSNDKHDGRW